MNTYAYLNDIKKQRPWLMEQMQEVHQLKESNKQPKGEFKFQPPKTIEAQLDELAECCRGGHFDRKIIIKGFKGTFKLEHWKMIELRLRTPQSVNSIKFIDTKLEKENLMILPIWFTWIRPIDLVIELQQNELDDQSIEQFIWQIFEKEINISQLYIISNPGIYKGFLLRKIKYYLKRKYENNLDFHYLLLKNKGKLSIAIIKIHRKWQVQRVWDEKEKARQKIDQTFYFNFTLDNCFTQRNWKGFEHLIKCTYNEDNLEQISHLDISNNYLGTQSSFNSACQKLAGAKGLVALKIKNQPLLNNAIAIQQLVGDRYDKFRVNHLDISDNPQLVEKAFELLTENIFLECKQINLNNSLPEDNKTLYKLAMLTQAYQQKNEQFDQLFKEKEFELDVNDIKLKKYSHRHNLQSFDMSKIENFNRYDQIENFFKTMILSKYSNIRKLAFLNLDSGRTEALCRALNLFNSETKSQYPKDFKLSLKKLKLLEQTYNMTIDAFKQFFLDFLFTQERNFLEITNFTFIKTFQKNNRREGLKEAALHVLEAVHNSQRNKETKFSIQSLKFFQANLEMDLTIFKCFLLTTNIKLETFKYFSDTMKVFFLIIQGEGNMYLNQVEYFLSNQPTNFVHSLKVLKFHSVGSIQFDVGKLIQLFIYSPKLQLKEFEFYKVKLSKSQITLTQLDQFISNNIQEFQILSLQSLKFGDFLGVGEEEFFKYIVFAKQIQLKNLVLKSMDINHLMNSLKNIQQNLYAKKINPLCKLKSLELDSLLISSSATWSKFSELLLFSTATLESLKFIAITLDDNFSIGVGQAASYYLEQWKNYQNSIKIQDEQQLRQLSFIDCNCSSDFLSLFFPIYCVEILEFKGCKNLQISMQQIKSNFINNSMDEIYFFKLRQFTLQDNMIEDLSIFDWMIQFIILNLKRQQLHTLNLINCNLNDEIIILLIKQVHQVLQMSNIRRVFSLRNINFSYNPQISEQNWVYVFQTILNQRITMQPEQLLQQQSSFDDVNTLISDNVKYVNDTLLQLRDKILINPKQFCPSFPKQLKKLEIDLLFENVKDQEMKKQLYQRIITGLIIQPDNCLKHLVVSNLDLDLFMLCTTRSIILAQEYQKIIGYSEYKLEQIHIKSVTQQNRESIELFFNTFLCNQQINLRKLTINGFRDQFLQLLLKLSENRNDYVLEKIVMEDSEDKLNEIQTAQFIDYFILGKVFPISSLVLSKGIIFENVKQLDNSQSVQSKLISFKVAIEERSKNHISTYQKIFSLLLQSFSILENLEITIKNADAIFPYIMENCKASKLQLQSLVINGMLSIDLTFFEFIQKCVESLKLLKLQKIVYSKQNEINQCLTQIYQRPKPNSILDLNIIEHEDTYFYYYNLVFNDLFGFTNLILRDLQSFSNLQISHNFIKLKYLKLDMGLNYDSDVQLSSDALTLISKKMIYNEESQLEEIVFMNCEFRVPQIKAIVTPASNFRDRINYSGRAASYYMNLKRIGLFYSLHISQEGVQLLLQDLIYFEFVNIEKIELQAIDLNDRMVNDLVKQATDWLHFQKRNKRQFGKVFPLRHLDIGKNEQLQDRLTWQKLLRTLVFTDKAPYLEILNLHFMALDDASSGYIAHQAHRYLNSKGEHFKLPLKTLNFSKNNFLTEKGWKNILNNFIFHPRVDLVELNLTSTQIDTEEKLQTILQSVQKRALLEKNKKLPLNTFQCFNVSLKNQLSPYLSNQPKKTKKSQDFSGKVNKWWKEGIFDEIPNHFGDQVEILNNIIYTRKELIIPSKINYVDCLKFSKFHLSFVEHYLKIINILFDKKEEFLQIYFSLSTLDKLSELYRYTTEKPSKPYPYYLIFQKEVYSYLKKQENKIRVINLIQSDFPQLEELNQFDVLKIWQNILKNKINIDQILMEYTLNDDLIEAMLKMGYTERHIISLCRLIPPSKVRISGSLSLQAIKGLYSILYDTYYFQFSVVDYKFDDFLNIGIGYGLREKVYQKAKGFYLYNLCDAFVSPTSKYVFNEQVQQLNSYLSKQRLNFFMIALTNFLFFGSTIIAPIFLIEFSDKHSEQYCQVTDGLQQYYFYIAFAFLSAVIEGYLYFSICEKIPQYIIQMENAVLQNETQITIKEYNSFTVSIDTQRRSLGNDDLVKDSLKNSFKKRVEKSYLSLKSKLNRVGKSNFMKQISRLKQFGMSQLFKFDLFGDITFILVLQNCNYTVLFYVAIAITAFTQGSHFIYFLYLIMKRFFRSQKTVQLISSSYINDFYSLGFQGRNAALSNLLDSIAPYNVSVIPNNKLTRTILPNQAGKSMSNLVKAYFMQFIFEDLPQIVIQTYFTVMQTWKFEGELEISTYIRIAISLLTVISSFFKFMSIRPTILAQDDFDRLSDSKKTNYKKVKKQLVENEFKQLEMFTKYGSVKQHF